MVDIPRPSGEEWICPIMTGTDIPKGTLMRRPRPAFIVLVLSVIAMLIAGTMLLTGALQRPDAVTPVGARPTPTPSAAVPSDARDSYRARPAPVRVRIPAIDVDAEVISVGIDSNLAVEVPENIFTVGWYKLGPAPGAPTGSAVLVGHRDGAVDGAGVFYNLGQLRPGDAVTVVDTMGERMRYEVIAREVIDKDAMPMAELFSPYGTPLLTLISCGGSYDRSNGGYQANVVVTAVPVEVST